MPRPHRHRNVSFQVINDHLEMHVVFPKQPSRDYVHRCSRDVFREVAYTIEDYAAGGTTLDQIVQAIDAPYTQVNVALGFMKERGCVEVHHRRIFPASDIVYEDAMIEFMHLADH
ncbi:MAG: hypothetical protein CMJ19_00860 [Phycisphaeraceae bacterium]|nr:hypothetical protein [Phycisphaeraceae bacterium]